MKHLQVLSALCESMEVLDEPEAKAGLTAGVGVGAKEQNLAVGLAQGPSTGPGAVASPSADPKPKPVC